MVEGRLSFSGYKGQYGERFSDRSHFFLVLCTLLGLSFAVSDFGDELVKSDHLNSYLNLSKFKVNQ